MLAATGEFLKALAVIRAADADAEAFAKVFEQAVQGIAGLVAKDSVQWHDLMRLLLTWAYWRRPADERENLEKVAVSSQREESVQKEVKSMSYNQGEKEGREEGRKEGALAAARFTLIAVIERKYKAVPEPLSLEIEACVDLGRLQAATSLAATAERVEEIML